MTNHRHHYYCYSYSFVDAVVMGPWDGQCLSTGLALVRLLLVTVAGCPFRNLVAVGVAVGVDRVLVVLFHKQR